MFLLPLCKKEELTNYKELIENFKEFPILNFKEQELSTDLGIKEKDELLYLITKDYIENINVIIIEDTKLKKLFVNPKPLSKIKDLIREKEKIQAKLKIQEEKVKNLKKENILYKFEIKNEDATLIMDLLNGIDIEDKNLLSSFEKLIEKYKEKIEIKENYMKLKNLI